MKVLLSGMLTEVENDQEISKLQLIIPVIGLLFTVQVDKKHVESLKDISTLLQVHFLQNYLNLNHVEIESFIFF